VETFNVEVVELLVKTVGKFYDSIHNTSVSFVTTETVRTYIELKGLGIF
jgi:hypothetical protein